MKAKEYQKAIHVQDACNLVAVLHSMLEAAKEIIEERGSYWHHPILRMYAEQVSHLTGGSGFESYSNAYKICESRANNATGDTDES